jgi:hypothetical protein
MSNFRNYKKTWDPTTGRMRFQRWDGGVFFDSLAELKPSMNVAGITGNGHQPLKSKAKENIIPNIEEEAQNIGNEILNRLKLRSGKGVDELSIEERIQKIIKGAGLQVTV